MEEKHIIQWIAYFRETLKELQKDLKITDGTIEKVEQKIIGYGQIILSKDDT